MRGQIETRLHFCNRFWRCNCSTMDTLMILADCFIQSSLYSRYTYSKCAWGMGPTPKKTQKHHKVSNNKYHFYDIFMVLSIIIFSLTPSVLIIFHCIEKSCRICFKMQYLCECYGFGMKWVWVNDDFLI